MDCRTIAISKNIILLIGGCDYPNYLKETWKYNIFDNKIFHKKEMNQQRSQFGIAFDEI